jgi:ribosomal protein S18 acetylase RimI-like enzyme
VAEPFVRTPWDSAALGCEAFELKPVTAETLSAPRLPGHYTARVDPLFPKGPLHAAGFYYCDTLIEPHCAASAVRLQPDARASLDAAPPLDPLLAICRVAFRHDRYHRDPAVPKAAADRRYETWLAQLHGSGRVLGLLWEGGLAAFIAHDGGRLALHAMDERFAGKGIAKHLWSAAISRLAAAGHAEITSSISASNLSALNLYASLGFRFRGPVDLYHRVER